jgi:hypothetical protein
MPQPICILIGVKITFGITMSTERVTRACITLDVQKVSEIPTGDLEMNINNA